MVWPLRATRRQKRSFTWRSTVGRLSKPAIACEPLEERRMLSLTTFLEDEIVVSISSSQKVAATEVSSFVQQFTWPSWADSSVLDSAQLVLSHPTDRLGGKTLVKLTLPQGVSPAVAAAELAGLSFTDWSSGVASVENPTLLIPNDPLFSEQYHHEIMQNIDAWDITIGSPDVVVAVLDTGLTYAHPDLYMSVMINVNEIPSDILTNLVDVDSDSKITFYDLNDSLNAAYVYDFNGTGYIDGHDLLDDSRWVNFDDEDGNGYNDDLLGWDFLLGINNVNDRGMHGTAVSGIIAATMNNNTGVVGTAPGVRIMPLRVGHPFGIDSADVAAALVYAADNGAKIANMSFVVNENDPILTAALNYAYDAGMIIVIAAGNSDEEYVNGGLYSQALHVASTGPGDLRSDFTSYGALIDISAPGEDLIAPDYPGPLGYDSGDYVTASGTSFSAPNIAAVAALIWSVNPSWTREQVVAQLIVTADAIDGLNPGYEGLMGAGRANTYRAITESPVFDPITIDSLTSSPGNPLAEGILSDVIQLRMSGQVDLLAFNDSANWVLRGKGADNTYNTLDDHIIPLMADVRGRVVTLTLLDTPLPGAYELRGLASDLVGAFGEQLDGNGDSTGGDDFVYEFVVSDSLVGIAAPAHGRAGNISFDFTVDDATPTMPEEYSYRIDWDNDGIADYSVTDDDTLTVVHSFDPGTYLVRVVVEDSNGALSTITHAIHVFRTQLVGTEAIWEGSGGDDEVEIEQTSATTVQIRTTRLGGISVSYVDNFTIGATGTVSAYSGAGNDVIDARGVTSFATTLEGGANDDTLYGGAGDDHLHGEGGHFDGYAGNDWLYGGAGNDQLEGGNGADVLFGDDGLTTVFGAQGNDTLIGGAGDDVLIGGGGDDHLEGWAGRDVLLGDYLPGLEGPNSGNDTLIGHMGDDTLLGGDGDDLLYANRVDGAEGDGAEGNDQLYGGNGNDTLHGGPGHNWLDGGAGDDFIQASVESLNGSAGIETLIGGAGNDTLVGGDAGDLLYGDYADGPGDDEGNDLLIGLGGNDTLYGGGGDDTLEGGAGDDELFGGQGDNVFRFSRSDDSIDLGSDYVVASSDLDMLDFSEFAAAITVDISQTVAVSQSGLTITLDDPETIEAIYGTPYSDSITGNDAQNLIIAGDGDDTITAGDGDDVIFAGDGHDLVDAGAGNDLVYGDGLEGDGAEGDDTLIGGAGNDTLYGNLGNDSLDGGANDDLLFGDGGEGTENPLDGDDTLIAGSGNDVLVGRGGNDLLLGISGSNLMIGGSGADTIVGGTGTDLQIAGYTDHDGDDLALLAILAEWSSGNSYATRLSNLENGGGLNGSYVLDSDTVFDDGDEDELTGDTGQDWFLYYVVDDTLTDAEVGEVSTNTPPV
ncbi:MAG: S8 family serine peptidase [Pirellulales bacterium]|nr:S8 family serine peptidase [Pirellulales bacterium]